MELEPLFFKIRACPDDDDLFAVYPCHRTWVPSVTLSSMPTPPSLPSPYWCSTGCCASATACSLLSTCTRLCRACPPTCCPAWAPATPPLPAGLHPHMERRYWRRGVGWERFERGRGVKPINCICRKYGWAVTNRSAIMNYLVNKKKLIILSEFYLCMDVVRRLHFD